MGDVGAACKAGGRAVNRGVGAAKRGWRATGRGTARAACRWCGMGQGTTTSDAAIDSGAGRPLARLWIGTYAAQGGAGLVPLHEDAAGRFSPGEPVAAIANAAWGLWCPERKLAYFVDEQDAGRVSAWTRDSEAGAPGWREHSSSATGGAMPCHVARDPEGRFLAVANYGDGSVALIGLDPQTGGIGGLIDVKRTGGRGPDAARQAGPHAHCVLFTRDGSALLHVDLGIDRVLRYPVSARGLGEPQVAFTAPPGSGPRMALMHPDERHGLLVCELTARLMVLRREGNAIVCTADEAMVPEGFAGENLGGGIALASRDRVLVSNRGHDSVAAFVFRDGALERAGWSRSGGADPRALWTDGRRVVVANEASGTVGVLDWPDPARPGAEPGQVLAVPGACFVIDVPD